MGSSASKKKPDTPPAPIRPKDDNNNKATLKIAHTGGPTYKPFIDFPDLQKLRQGQTDFAASTYDIDNDPDGLPIPFPTITRFSEAADKNRLNHIDQHVMTVPPDLARDNTRLVGHLLSEARTDVEKVWAIFAWISSRDRTNVFPELENGEPPDGSALHDLSQIMIEAKTYMYNKLFEKMCREANIPCKVVSGRVRAGAKELGDEPKSVTQYCMVFVDRHWRFVHQHWGSCFVKNVRTADDWKLVEGVSGAKSGLSKATPEHLGFDREEFWFMTDPEVMVHLFCSEDPKKQLLARPVTIDEFSQMARLYKPFFEMGLTSVKPPKCKLDVDEQFVVEIGVPQECKAKFDYGIYKRAMDPDIKSARYKNLKQFVFMDRADNKIRAKFEIPLIGMYKFEINAVDPQYAGSVTLCEYLIDCRTPNFRCRPYPANALNEWGAGPVAKEVGLEPISTDGGLIETERGKAVIKFKLKTSTTTKFIYKLEAQDKNNTIKLDDYVRHYMSEDKETIVARTPQHGHYILKIYSKEVTERTSKLICSYLVKSDQGISDTTPFPEASDGQIGNVQNIADWLVPVTHKEALIDKVPEGSLEIRMKEDSDLDVLPVLTTNDNRDKSNYVYHYKTGKERVFVVLFPEAGWFNLKMEAKPKDSKKTFTTAYQYTIVVDEPTSNCVPFPFKTRAWDDRDIVIEPKEGLLIKDKEYYFRYAIRDGASVFLVRDGREVELSRSDSDTAHSSGDVWEVRTNSGASGNDIRVCVRRTGSNDIEHILEYKVLSNDEERLIVNNQREAEDRAQQRKREIEGRERHEEKQAEERKKKLEDKAKMDELDFAKNKTKYLEKQKKLEEEALRKDPTLGQSFKEFQGRSEEPHRDTEHWKSIWKDIQGKMHIEKLKEAIKSGEKKRLEAALNEAKDNNVPNANPVYVQAQKELDVLTVKQDLKNAMEQRDPEAIVIQIQRISDNTFYMSRLQQNAAEAYQLLERIRKIRDMRVSHLDLKAATLTEMRRYNNPPKEIHEVMQATLLLFEEDEERTESWKYCQQYINPTGPQNMIRKVMEFEPKGVHPDIAARSKAILEQYDMEKIQDVSPAAATFYAWTMGIVDGTLSSSKDKVTPASVRRQKELFGRPEPSPRRSFDFRFSMRKPQGN